MVTVALPVPCPEPGELISIHDWVLDNFHVHSGSTVIVRFAVPPFASTDAFWGETFS